MPEADIIPITSTTRRNVLGLAAVAFSVALTKPASASILSLCAAFDALQRSKQAIFDAMPDGYERECAVDEIDLQQEPMVERVAELHATTMEEHRARARSLSFYLGEQQLREDAESGCWHERLTAAILRDLAAMPG